MFIYIAVFVLSSIFSYLYTISKDSSASFCFLVLCFLSIFLPAAFRYGIGADYFGYLTIYDQIALNRPIRQEFTIVCYSKLLQYFDLPGHAIIVFYAFITYLFIFLAIPKKHFFWGIPIFVLVFYLDSYTLLRQSLACATMLYACSHLYKGNHVRFFFWSFFSLTNHKVMLIAILLVLLTKFLPLLRKKYYIGIFVILVLFLRLFLNTIVNRIMNDILPVTFFSMYAKNKYAIESASSNTGIGFLLKVVILFLLLLLISTKKNKIYKFGIIAIYYNLFTLFLAQTLYIFGRLVNSFSFIYIFFFSYLIQKRSKLSFLMKSTILFLFFLLFIASIINTPIRFGFGQAGGKQIYPYVSIFDKYSNYAIQVKYNSYKLNVLK